MFTRSMVVITKPRNHSSSFFVFVVVLALSTTSGTGARAQTAPSSHVVIPFLANASNPAALEYEGAECETNRTGTTLRCEFQQVFLTSNEVPDTCLVTTNRYEKTFMREGDGVWVSRDVPSGICGVTEVATLRDEGGVRWTLEVKKVVTRKEAAASCAGEETAAARLSWQNLRRPLPCKFVQPGGLSR